MGKNKLDAVNFCKFFDMFGEDAAKETLADVNTIPEDGVITKEQFKTVAGENKNMQSV